MTQAHSRTVDTDAEVIEILVAIPHEWQEISAYLPQDNPRKEENIMSKVSEMAATIEELRSAAAAINEAANWLAQQFSGSEEAPVEEAKPEKKPALTLEQVRAVLAEKSRAGHTAAIRTLLQKYGASKLSGIDPQHYEALLQEVEVL